MRTSLLALMLLVLALPVCAERVWVVGSFSHKDNALRLMERLSEQLGVEVMVVPYAAGGTHRVVIREVAISDRRLEEAGVTAWLANLDVPSSGTSRVESVEPAPASAEQVPLPKPVVLVADTEPVLPDIEVNESIEVYCGRLPLGVAKPSYCSPELLAELGHRRALVREKQAQLESDCDQVSSDRERSICDAWRSGKKLDSIADQ